MKKKSILLTILALNVSFVFAMEQNTKLAIVFPAPPANLSPSMTAPGLKTPEITQIKEETKVKTESISSSSVQQPVVITKQSVPVINDTRKSPISGSDTIRPLTQEEVTKLKDLTPPPSNINKSAPDVVNKTDTQKPVTAVVIEKPEKKSFFRRIIDFFRNLF